MQHITWYLPARYHLAICISFCTFEAICTGTRLIIPLICFSFFTSFLFYRRGVNDASAFAEARAENRWSVNRHPLFDDARAEIRLSSRSLWGQRPLVLRLNSSSQGPPRPPGHLLFLVYYSSWKRSNMFLFVDIYRYLGVVNSSFKKRQ